jgi:NAD(P)-dependent dehydrogenase (short-subunit alcohol dehydrogenase family)
MTDSTSSVWFSTGAARGMRVNLVRAALDAGHRVVATARAAAWCLAKGADVGIGAILHHDFARRARVDAEFHSRPQPVSRDTVRAEDVGPALTDYLATDCDDLVA